MKYLRVENSLKIREEESPSPSFLLLCYLVGICLYLLTDLSGF